MTRNTTLRATALHRNTRRISQDERNLRRARPQTETAQTRPDGRLSRRDSHSSVLSRLSSREKRRVRLFEADVTVPASGHAITSIFAKSPLNVTWSRFADQPNVWQMSADVSALPLWNLTRCGYGRCNGSARVDPRFARSPSKRRFIELDEARVKDVPSLTSRRPWQTGSRSMGNFDAITSRLGPGFVGDGLAHEMKSTNKMIMVRLIGLNPAKVSHLTTAKRGQVRYP